MIVKINICGLHLAGFLRIGKYGADFLKISNIAAILDKIYKFDCLVLPHLDWLF
jgi:hypothetical protein